MLYFNQNYACISESSEINIFDTLNNSEFSLKVKDFYDLTVWDKTEGEFERAINFITSGRYKILTSEGYSETGKTDHLVYSANKIFRLKI